MENQEIWKIIPNTNDMYMVSNCGRVKSLKNNKEKMLTPYQNNWGYVTVTLRIGDKHYIRKVHQLVATAFLNHTPCGNKVIVDHIDNNKSNNHLSNLQLISQRENLSKDKVNGSSKHVGVCWNRVNQNWVAYIKIDGKRKHLGSFKNELDAANAYQEALNNL